MITNSLYIHIPFCRQKCPYCGFYSEPVNRHNTRRYIDAVIKEILSYDLNAADIKTIYIGGGTPTIVPEKTLMRLLEFIAANFPAVEEFTIETNPSRHCRPNWENLAALGINRVSVGIQSLIPRELELLAREYKPADISDYLEQILNQGISNIAADLIFALPGSSLKSWDYTITEAAKLSVKHISAYSLSYDEGTPFSRLRESGVIETVDEETDRQMYNKAIETLAAAGFGQYEISNFAQRGFQCRHNLTYWHNKGYIGVGAAAGSFHNHIRSENIADIKQYTAAIENGLPVKAFEDEIRGRAYACETAVLTLRTTQGIDIAAFEEQTGFDLLQTFPDEIERNISLNLLENKNGRISLNASAAAIADGILCDFAV
jgi:oxygen-independent coproporphyrinogen III oxidase